ncbi:Ubiquitin thioesterase otulin [Frankliniella fusca]|uniref:Ubiquitin thioesterase otulin n=1 Tax=Frankliniella fusca TaxID=407009 RepID=A0AAE1LBW4_9NEOP|nr:Ubiquitin thioesterase otulin [Frankliniella fusca]
MGDSWAVEWRPLLPLPTAAAAGAVATAPPWASAWASPHPAHGASKQVEMVSFGVDPQWGGLLYSLCSRHEDAGAVLGAGGGIIFPNVLADSLAASAAVPGASGDLVNVLGSGCLDMYSVSVSSVWAIIVETAKATGMVVLLGVGSLLFYRVFHSIRSRLHGLKLGPAPGRRVSSGPGRPSSRSLTSSGEDSDGESSEDEAGASVRGFETLAEDVEITGMYFGPGADSSMDGSTTSLPCPAGGRAPARAPGQSTVAPGRAAAMRRARRLSRRSIQDDEQARDADVSSGSRSPRTPPEERVSGAYRGGGGAGGAAPVWQRGASLYRRAYRPPPTRGSSAASTPCSTRSTSSASTPEYPPYRSSHAEARRSRRQHRPDLEASVSVSREDSVDGGLADPRDAVLRGLHGLGSLSREDSTDSLARRFMARDESFESLFAYQQGRRRSLSRNPSSDSLCLPYPARRLPRNESVDSLGFPRHGLTRGSSFDSTCSEMSLDVSLIAELEAKAEGAGADGGATLEQLEQLQREIDQLKSNCLSLDEEFETVRCNRNLPGMSSLLEVKAESRAGGAAAAEDDAEALAERARARACFAGLYSLTRITSSPSLDLDQLDPVDQDLSDWDQGLPLQGRALPPTVSEEPLTSLEWDEEDMSYPDTQLEDSGVTNDLLLGACAANMSPVCNKRKTEGCQKQQLSLDASLRDSDSMLTSSMATFELDADSEVGDPSAPIPDLDQEQDEVIRTEEIVIPRDNLHLPLSEVIQDNNAESTISPNSPESWLKSEGALTHSSSSSGVSVLSRSLSGLSDAWCSSAAITPATPASPLPIAIGQRLSIQEYVRREWQGDTKKARTIVMGYSEIPGILGLNTIRVVRGDNYCAVRGTIFQALVRGLPLPSGQAAANRCSLLLAKSSGHWLRSWNFAGRLPYAGANVENGIRDCLLSIDSTVERLQLASDRESALANMLNADPWLDARLCEAVKLLMLVGALELKNAADQGAPLPLFAELLFARETSSTPCDLMNNHLRNVGDTAGLEQAVKDEGKVEMFLLGYSLGIRIRVVRPSAFGSQDYVCSYPNPEDIGVDMSEGVDNRRLVDLLAEDDRHYNILIA